MGNRLKRQMKRHGQKLPDLMPVKTTATPENPTEHDEVSLDELKGIIERSASGPLDEPARQLLLSVSETLSFLTEQLAHKQVSIARLRKLLFGASTETLKNLESTPDQDKSSQESSRNDEPTSSEPKPGHGRHGAEDYTGAKKVNIPHQDLKAGDPCPHCLKGTLYRMTKPSRVTRVTGQAPLQATVYELENLRCGLCGKIFTAEAPPEVGPEKYDAESISMIALLKYGSGMPFNRLERLQATLGIPLAAATQWGVLSQAEPAFTPIYQALIRAAAQGNILHNDDTAMKVLNLAPGERKGVFTSGIVSVDDDHLVALFFTGHQHAGENLADVLKHRAGECEVPIQMSDGLSRNLPGSFETLVAHCLAHGRRKFVDVYDAFEPQCHHVLEVLARVYQIDSETQGLSESERLAYHQQHSGPLMAELKDWMEQQLDDKKVEPNSGLGEAIRYMIKHWEPLTLFLRHGGAPLDNNLCERALKKAILHRKNAYYYKTANGARVGDLFMSLIHTCELNEINPFDYLTVLQKHTQAVASDPNAWLPWTFQKSLTVLEPLVKA